MLSASYCALDDKVITRDRITSLLIYYVVKTL